jgi:hypothetical protein
MHYLIRRPYAIPKQMITCFTLQTFFTSPTVGVDRDLNWNDVEEEEVL